MSRIRFTARWFSLLVVMVAAVFSATGQAQAADDLTIARCAVNTRCMPQTRLADVNHIGWVHLNLNYCDAGMMCPKIYRVSTGAWSWNGKAWSRTSINGGWVYVYPYTGSWRWAWTQESGWVAMDSGRFELRPQYPIYY
ncbi:MAG: hypothetical protein JWM86_1411 [Thermoleophilia bacterium]|nr:hypothetical protein [Thermoleophilia bacterium]